MLQVAGCCSSLSIPFPSALDPQFPSLFLGLCIFVSYQFLLSTLSMTSRSKRRIDYSVFHKTGRKVDKEGGRGKMADLEVQELQVVGDIKHSLELYDLEDLVTEREISEGMSALSELGKSYRHLHVELKSQLGTDYEEKYPRYGKIHDDISTYLKAAKLKLRGLDVTSDLSKKRQILVELETLEKKVHRVNVAVDVYVVFNDDITRYISKMETFIDAFYELVSKSKMSGLDKYDIDEVENRSMGNVSEIEGDIHLAKELRREFDAKCLTFEKAKKSETQELSSISNAENLKAEISYQFKSLSKRFQVDLEGLGDYQILEIHQDKKNADSEVASVMRKVTELSVLVPSGGQKVARLFEQVSKTRDRLCQKREVFFAKLEKMILERDITVDKLRSAAELTIELPKFSGYDGKIDIFSFRSEFVKLVEPRVQKIYHADYLKRNYLSGPALVLVEKETKYEKIWEKLLASYGNTRLLLQNKLSALDKFSLAGAKSDKKTCNVLANLINTMQELSTLASDHSIEGQLYEGGGPEKILFLLGEARHKKFISKNLDAEYTKKQEWQKLKEFLEKELKLLEKLTFDHKTAEQLGLSLRKEGPKKCDSSHNAQDKRLLCHICDQDGHTAVKTARGNLILPYYVCEKFVKMTPEERLAKLESKNLCTVCLYPGAIKNPQHKCYYTNFCCPHHGKQDKIHFLLCGKHKHDQKNIAMFQRFKARFIENCPTDLPEFVKSFTFVSITYQTSQEPFSTLGKHHGIPDITETAIFMLQRVQVETVSGNFFFDNGCLGMIVRESFAIELVKIGRAEKIDSGPIDLLGVGDQKTICTSGCYKICLPLHDGQNAIVTAIALPKITIEFPEYDLTEVQKDFSASRQNGGKKCRFPNLPKNVGGDTDLLIGSRYLRYFPKMIKQLKSGLQILKSVFKAPDGSRGVVNGPHPSFAQFVNGSHVSRFVYLSSTSDLINLWKLEDSLPLLGKDTAPVEHNVDQPICCENADAS